LKVLLPSSKPDVIPRGRTVAEKPSAQALREKGKGRLERERENRKSEGRACGEIRLSAGRGSFPLLRIKTLKSRQGTRIRGERGNLC